MTKQRREPALPCPVPLPAAHGPARLDTLNPGTASGTCFAVRVPLGSLPSFPPASAAAALLSGFAGTDGADPTARDRSSQDYRLGRSWAARPLIRRTGGHGLSRVLAHGGSVHAGLPPRGVRQRLAHSAASVAFHVVDRVGTDWDFATNSPACSAPANASPRPRGSSTHDSGVAGGSLALQRQSFSSPPPCRLSALSHNEPTPRQSVKYHHRPIGLKALVTPAPRWPQGKSGFPQQAAGLAARKRLAFSAPVNAAPVHPTCRSKMVTGPLTDFTWRAPPHAGSSRWLTRCQLRAAPFSKAGTSCLENGKGRPACLARVRVLRLVEPTAFLGQYVVRPAGRSCRLPRCSVAGDGGDACPLLVHRCRHPLPPRVRASGQPAAGSRLDTGDSTAFCSYDDPR